MHEHVNNAVREYLRFSPTTQDVRKRPAADVVKTLMESLQNDQTEREYADVLERISLDVVQTLWAARHKGGADKYITECLDKLGLVATPENTATVLELLLKTSRDLNVRYYDGFATSLQYRTTCKLAKKLHYVSEQLTHILIDSPDRNETFRRIESILREMETQCTLTTPPPQNTSDS